MKESESVVQLDNRQLRLTNLEKPLWPRFANDGTSQPALTKAELISYYLEVANYLLPHLRDRPLTVTRYPNGIEGKSFYQKQCPEHAPEWVQTFPVPGTEKITEYIVCNDRPTLIWLANQAALELHPALWRIDKPEYPDVVVIDLDPAPPAGFQDAIEVGQLVQRLLEELRIQGFPKTSGATGIHIYIPVDRVYTFEQTRDLAGRIGKLLLEVMPEKVTTERMVKDRTGKVYVDHLQNLAGKTMVAPYSPRLRPGGPVSTPIRWDELSGCQPDEFNLLTVPRRLQIIGDLFAAVEKLPQRLEHAFQLLGV